MMNFWTIEGIKPDADISVLVITDQDERTMAFWDGEAWLTAEDEVPLSGDVTHWCTLEELPTSKEIIRANSKHAEQVGRLEEASVNLRDAYDNKCQDCDLLKYNATTQCSDCGGVVPEGAVVKRRDFKWLCPKCAAKAFQEVLRG